MKLISIIVSCHNEEKNISKVIDEIKKNNLSNSEIIVVDNNSRDDTFKNAKKKGVIIVKERRVGKGRAMKNGAKKAEGEILVFIDGDNSYAPEFIKKIIEIITEKKSDIVYGSRFLKRSISEISFLRLLGNKIFSSLGLLLYEKRIDFLTGLFAIKKNNFFELNLKSNGFEIETEIFAKSVKKDFKIEETAIRYKANKESKINPVVDGFKIFFALIKHRIC